jgi:hypothetical protein
MKPELVSGQMISELGCGSERRSQGVEEHHGALEA